MSYFIFSKHPETLDCHLNIKVFRYYLSNIKNFIEDLKNSTVDLSPVKFMIIGVGDSNYDTFCKAALDIQKLLLSKNCNEVITLKTLDMREEIDPEDLAQQWLTANSDLL